MVDLSNEIAQPARAVNSLPQSSQGGATRNASARALARASNERRVMNVAALLQGGVSRVLRTARAVLNAVDDSSPRPEDAGESPVAADFCFRCACLQSAHSVRR